MDIIAVILLILSVLAKALDESKKKQKRFQEKNKEVKRMPIDDITKKVLEDKRPLAKVETLKREIRKEITEHLKQTVDNEEKKVGKKSQLLSSAKKSIKRDTIPMGKAQNTPLNDGGYDLTFSENQIVQGMIMAEILQPPKAKRR